MANTIQIKRGVLANIGTLNPAEFAFTTDTHELFIGDGVVNHELALDRIEIGTAQGQLAFWDATTLKWVHTETSELFWDDAGKKFGIGTTAPSQKLDVFGKIAINGIARIYIPDQTNFVGTMYLGNGDGGASLSNTTGGEGQYNTFVGIGTGNNNTTGSSNTANGYRSLFSNTTGSSNTANGYASLYSNTTGIYNTANGHRSLFSNTTGSSNTANGMQSGRYIADGTTTNKTSNNSLYLGYDTRALADGDTNEIVIGASAIGVGSNSVVLGNDSITKTILKGNVGIGTTEPTNILSFGGNAARTWWLERHTTTNTAGKTLTIQAGGATAAATDKAGGNLILAPGLSTGTGNNQILFKTSTPGSTGTADNALATRVTLDYTGLTLANISHETTDVDKILVSNAGLVKYRTGAELLSDVGLAIPTTQVAYGNATSDGLTSDANLTRSSGLLTLIDGTLLLIGEIGTTPASDAGIRLMWIPSKYAFRAGSVDGTQWDDANIGNYSLATGNSTTASGTSSSAFGDNSVASAEQATALSNSTANGATSVAMTSGEANAGLSVAIGTTVVDSYLGVAIGRYNIGGGTPTSWVSTDPIFEIGIGSNPATLLDAIKVLKSGEFYAYYGFHLTGGFYDSGNNAGDSGQILSSTATGIEWVTLPTSDNYVSWNLKTDGTQRLAVVKGQVVDFVAGTNISIVYSGSGIVTINNTKTLETVNAENISGVVFTFSDATTITESFSHVHTEYALIDSLNSYLLNTTDTFTGTLSLVGSLTVTTGLITAAASTTAGAGLNLREGGAPTSPNDGDIWTTGTGMYIRATGVTKNLLWSSSGTPIADNQVAIGNGDGIEGSANLTWDLTSLDVNGVVLANSYYAPNSGGYYFGDNSTVYYGGMNFTAADGELSATLLFESEDTYNTNVYGSFKFKSIGIDATPSQIIKYPLILKGDIATVINLGINVTSPVSTLDLVGSLGFNNATSFGANVMTTLGAGGGTLPTVAASHGRTYYIAPTANCTLSQGEGSGTYLFSSASESAVSTISLLANKLYLAYNNETYWRIYTLE